MKPEQIIIVQWMQAQLDRMRIAPSAWARRAGFSPTTITRAMTPDYGSITSIPTLVELANAAQVPTCLDFLAAQSLGLGMPDALRQVLAEILNLIGGVPDRSNRIAVSNAMFEALVTVSRAPTEAQNDPLFIASVARAAVSRAGIGVS